MEFKFKFLNGWYLVVSDDDKKQDALSKLVNIQDELRSLFPSRYQEVDGFVLSCANEVMSVKV